MEKRVICPACGAAMKDPERCGSCGLSPAEIVHAYMLATDDWHNLHQKQPDDCSFNNLCGNIIEGVKSEYAASLERDFNLAGFSAIH